MLDDTLRIITSGLSPDDRYVTRALMKVRDGMKVNPSLPSKIVQQKKINDDVQQIFHRPPDIRHRSGHTDDIGRTADDQNTARGPFPDITPPTVVVEASYPGADAQTVAETVGAPIEEQVNGVEGMMYMSSNSGSDGSYSLTVTFEAGTDLDIASVKVRNRGPSRSHTAGAGKTAGNLCFITLVRHHTFIALETDRPKSTTRCT